MSHRRELEKHRHKLGEIREMMDAMKTMAYMETHKLVHFLDAQIAVVDTIERVATDFVSYYPEALPKYSKALDVYLLVGSERGFCGNFNTTLMESYKLEVINNPIRESVQIAVGRKLHTTFDDRDRGDKMISIDGANVVEEVDIVLGQVIDTLAELQKKHKILSLSVLYHGGDERKVLIEKLLPPFEQYKANRKNQGYAPLINIPADELLLELSEHYLFAALYKILYISLMAENHSRVEHLENAVKKLDEKLSQLVSQENRVRQEEIIEEIEIILISADNLT